MFFQSFNKILIPSKISIICDNAFCDSVKLTNVDIPINSNLQIIGKHAFSSTKIKRIVIPSNVSIIDYGAFSNCRNILIIEISEGSKLDSFPFSSFDRNIKAIIMISSSCEKLTKNIF